MINDTAVLSAVLKSPLPVLAEELAQYVSADLWVQLVAGLRNSNAGQVALDLARAEDDAQKRALLMQLLAAGGDAAAQRERLEKEMACWELLPSMLVDAEDDFCVLSYLPDSLFAAHSPAGVAAYVGKVLRTVLRRVAKDTAARILITEEAWQAVSPYAPAYEEGKGNCGRGSKC